jgi:heme-degrading monooxygenase HmoA
MNCTRIALYDITSGKFDEVAAEAKAEMAPLFEQSPGFVSYAVAQVDDTKFVSVSTWQMHEQADAATAKAAVWVKDHSRDRFTLRQTYTGDLAIDIQAKTAELAH